MYLAELLTILRPHGVEAVVVLFLHPVQPFVDVDEHDHQGCEQAYQQDAVADRDGFQSFESKAFLLLVVN